MHKFLEDLIIFVHWVFPNSFFNSWFLFFSFQTNYIELEVRRGDEVTCEGKSLAYLKHQRNDIRPRQRKNEKTWLDKLELCVLV